MYIFAFICLLAGLVVSLGASALAAIQIWEKRQNCLPAITAAQYIISSSLILASACLLHGLFWQEYSLEYVSSYTDKFLPIFYRLTAFWAGQPGSMLFWALITALAGTWFALSKTCKNESAEVRLWFWCFFYAVMAFFGLILTCWSNPFITLDPAPLDGNGLNPLLQNPGMIIHPPLLFAGYALFTIPACLSMAQLAGSPHEEHSWTITTRPYFILSWSLLTAGIILGAWWAYMELGWGGYWAWDPVENASLLPWLTGTAALHIIAISNRSGALDKSAAFLMGITVTAAFFATYLTRSGVIQSVHAFGDGGVGTPLLIFIVATLVLVVYIPLTCRTQPARALGEPLSREGALVLTSWLFLSLAAIILFATMWPVLSKLWNSSSQGLDASFYNRVCLPLCTGLILLLGVCFGLKWRGGLKNASRFMALCGAFIATLGALWISGYRHPLALIAASAAVGALCVIAMALCSKSTWQVSRKSSTLVLHGGIALLALGVAFSGPYKIEEDLIMSEGQSEKAGPYEVTLKDIRDGKGDGYDFLQATLALSSGGKQIATLYPERRIYAKFGNMQFSEVDVKTGLGQDIYTSLLGMDEDHKILVRISLEPLVNWIWIGGAIMCIVPLFSLKNRKKHII